MLKSGVGDLGVVEDQYLETGHSFEVHKASVGDLGVLKVYNRDWIARGELRNRVATSQLFDFGNGRLLGFVGLQRFDLGNNVQPHNQQQYHRQHQHSMNVHGIFLLRADVTYSSMMLAPTSVSFGSVQGRGRW